MPDETDYESKRNTMHEALTTAVQEGESEDTVLTGWILIYEGVHHNGKRSLTFVSADATGEAEATPWQAIGYIHHIIDSGVAVFPEDLEEDDEED